MRRYGFACCFALVVLSMADGPYAATGAAAGVESAAGVTDPQRAEFNWVMHCRGCHGASAEGSERGAPRMAGVVAKFLRSAEGRDYLVRVPGVAFVSLPDDELAELLNWTVRTFDPVNLPQDFTPYTAAEVGMLREDPLISEAGRTRERILDDVGSPIQ